jgi:hypothetical protein
MGEIIKTGAVTVGYETSWGERVKLAVCADRYERGGALALPALDATDPGDEDEFLELWCSLTVNLPGDPVASAWCSEAGHVVLDANNVPAALVDALVGAGVVELAGRSGRPAGRAREAPRLRGDRAVARLPCGVRMERPAGMFPAGRRHPSGLGG